MLRQIEERFDLETEPASPVTARIVSEVGEDLEAEIIAFVRTIPRYSQYPFTGFSVRTNNSFERILDREEAWSFMPIGNTPAPKMFVCGTGHGDGTYEVLCRYEGSARRKITIDFVPEG